MGLHLFVLGTPLMALVNPLFWAMTIVWYAQQPEGIALLFPPSVYYIALFCFLIGNAAVVYMNLLTTRIMARPGLMVAALAVPLYWVHDERGRRQGRLPARLHAVLLGEDLARAGRPTRRVRAATRRAAA
jgi:hypothetical protein